MTEGERGSDSGAVASLVRTDRAFGLGVIKQTVDNTGSRYAEKPVVGHPRSLNSAVVTIFGWERAYICNPGATVLV